METGDEQRTELLWRRIVDLRSREVSEPLDTQIKRIDSAEALELERLAEGVADVVQGELPLGRNAAREDIVRRINAEPITHRKTASIWDRCKIQLTRRAPVVLAILLLATVIALAAANLVQMPVKSAGETYCDEPSSVESKAKFHPKVRVPRANTPRVPK